MSKTRLKEIKGILEQIAKDEGIHPSEVKQKDLLSQGITAYELNKLGGLSLIKKDYPLTDKALGEIYSAKKNAGYIASLEKALGEKIVNDNKILESLEKIVPPLKVPKAVLPKKTDTSHVRRDVVVMVNDTHFGLIVDKKDVNGVNEYNWEIASRRMAFLAKQVAEYKIEKRPYVDNLHIVINGDILSGIIHDTRSRGYDLLGVQQNGALHILTHFISYVSQVYKNTIVYMGTGNHDDAVHRREGGRVISHVSSDSFSTPVFYAISLAFRTCKNIQFKGMDGLYLDMQLPGGRACAVHGHILFTKQLGNPGSNLNIKGLSDAINRFNTGEMELGRKRFELVLIAHTHVKVNFITFDGVEVYNAPSLSGTDGYAHSLGINSNLTGQLIFESSKDFIISDTRMVSFKTCDKDSSLDKIVPTYRGGLVWGGQNG